MALDFTHREFKLLLKPEHFRSKKNIYEFQELLKKSAAKFGVDYEPFDAIESQARQVHFYDTPNNALRSNRVILRLRRDATGGFPDEMWEITLKRRSPDFDEAAKFDPDTSMVGLTKKLKFKEELIRGEELGSMKSIYSHNVCIQFDVLKFEHPVSELQKVFPGLQKIDLNPEHMVTSVNDANVIEIQANLGNFRFSKSVVTDCGLAVWVRPATDSFDVLCAEFGFAYHVTGDDKNKKGHAASDQFFKEIQTPLHSMLADGTTKTAKIYGDEETTK